MRGFYLIFNCVLRIPPPIGGVLVLDVPAWSSAGDTDANSRLIWSGPEDGNRLLFRSDCYAVGGDLVAQTTGPFD